MTDFDDAVPEYARASATPPAADRVTKTVTACLDIHHMTEKGVKVAVHGGDKAPFWLPRSQIEMPDGTAVDDTAVDVIVPDWLAKQHGIT